VSHQSRPTIVARYSRRNLLLALLLLFGWVPYAYAYIDPNTTGQLYQLLFPAFIAIASAIAALRRSISHLCSRVLQACLRVLRRTVGASSREAGS
jgi:hypothetical protein